MKQFCGAFTLAMFAGFLLQFPAQGDPAPTERLSIAITNSYGDVFTNLVVSKVVGDGLVLQHKAGQMKIKFTDLPREIREKYQPLASEADSKEKQAASANAAFVASQRKAEAEQMRATLRHQSIQATGAQLRIEVPKQGWGISILNPGLRPLGQQASDNQFVYRAMGPNGFNLSIFVETAANGGVGNSDVFNFYWPKASRNPLIDENSIKTQMLPNFVKVTYTTLGMPNGNYYFAFKSKWVDVHISQTAALTDATRLFADFERTISYGE